MGYNINKNKKRQVQKDMCIIIILDAPFFGLNAATIVFLVATFFDCCFF